MVVNFGGFGWSAVCVIRAFCGVAIFGIPFVCVAYKPIFTTWACPGFGHCLFVTVVACYLLVNIKNGKVVSFGWIPSETLGTLKQDIFFMPGVPISIVDDCLFPTLIINQLGHVQFFDIIAPVSPSPHNKGPDKKSHLTLQDFVNLDPRKGVIEQIQVGCHFMLLLLSDIDIERRRLIFASHSNASEVVTFNFTRREKFSSNLVGTHPYGNSPEFIFEHSKLFVKRDFRMRSSSRVTDRIVTSSDFVHSKKFKPCNWSHTFISPFDIQIVKEART